MIGNITYTCSFHLNPNKREGTDLFGLDYVGVNSNKRFNQRYFPEIVIIRKLLFFHREGSVTLELLPSFH